MKKKLLICAALSATALSVAAFAGCGLFSGGNSGDGDTVEQDNMRFVLKTDGTYELDAYEYAYIEDGDGNRYTGNGETVTVPATVNGKAVTSVAGYAFGNTGVKTVTLPDSVSVIPERLFDGCELLETVNTSVITSIGSMAFYNCQSLESIEFKSGLTEIGERAFQNCPSLTNINLPDTVTTIGDDCFWACTFESLNTTGVEILGESAFYGCANLTALALPNIKTIGGSAFRNCGKLAELTIGNKLENYTAALSGCNSLTKVSISSSVPAEMFQWNESITDLTLGEGVTSIGKMAFGYTKGVKKVTLPSTLVELDDSAFWESSITEVNIPASVKTMGENVFYNCSSLASVTIEDGVESIGVNAFAETAITSLSLPASVKTVGDKAFLDCNSLTSITFAEGLEAIGKLAFAIKGAETLEIELPSSVKSIGDGCFNYSWGNDNGITAKKISVNDTVETVGENILSYCKVKELVVPASCGHNAGTALEKLTLFGEGEIPDGAYKNCVNLKTVDLGGGVNRIGMNAFKALEKINLDGVEFMGTGALGDLSTLNYTKIEDGVKYIDSWVIAADYSDGNGASVLDLSGVTGIYHRAFEKTDESDTSVLTTIILVDSNNKSNIKFIGQRAFNGSGITAVEVPASAEVWSYAFYGCTSLVTVSISSGITSVAPYAFANCTNLDTLNLSATDLTEIGNSAFSGCTKLRLVTLSDGVKKIAQNAFSGCKALSYVDLKGVEDIGEYAFFSCTELYSVTMDSVITISNNAFTSCTSLIEYDLTDSVTEIGYSALGCAQTVNYAGTQEQWDAIVKGTESFPLIWHSSNDLTVVFSDGTTQIYKRAG